MEVVAFMFGISIGLGAGMTIGIATGRASKK
jgi:hypothetical protein